MTTLKSALERFIDETEIGFYGTATAKGSSSVTDATNFQNANLTSGALKGYWFHFPTATAANAVRPATTLSGAVLSTGGASTDTTETYYRLTRPDWHPTRYLVPLANRALEMAWQWWRTVITPVTDGDMETSGVTNWTATNSTRLKDASIVWAGTASLDVTNTSANGYVQSAVFVAAPSRGFRFSAKCRPRVGTAKLIVYDVTNSAVIATSQAVSGVGTWQDVMVTGSYPDTCYQAAVRLLQVGSTDRANWDDVTGYWNLMTRISLPSWVTQYRTEQGEEALRIYQQRNRLGTYDSWVAHAYDLALLDDADFQIDSEPSAVNALSLELARIETSYNWPLILEARRPYYDFGAVSADTDTSACPLRLWVAAMKVLAARERNLTDRLPQWEHDYNREQWRGQSKLEVPAPDARGMRYQVLG